MSRVLKKLYSERQKEIEDHLKKFNKKEEKERYAEFIFCILTPQSNGKKCWEAVEIILKENPKDEKSISKILKGRSRFHNTKAKRILLSKSQWNEVKEILNRNEDALVLRNKIEEKVNGYGLKEASHFIRNIGLSNNKVAILDRHILRNLKKFNAIKDIEIKGKKGYLQLEKQAIEFSKKVNIPIDHLDVLFWHLEHGEYFK
ncbi:MAG TPA: hypothetical protein VHA12_01990 [Candidatus Nanoarchaeia archaeon]|nr:hypothetical protein [Candidatus Nanoarchaeia archaeon]